MYLDVVLVWRNLFSSHVCLILFWYREEKFCLGHLVRWRGSAIDLIFYWFVCIILVTHLGCWENTKKVWKLCVGSERVKDLMPVLFLSIRSSSRGHHQWDFLKNKNNKIIQNLSWYYCWSWYYWKPILGDRRTYFHCDDKGLSRGLHIAHEGDFWLWSAKDIDCWNGWSSTIQVYCQCYAWR